MFKKIINAIKNKKNDGNKKTYNLRSSKKQAVVSNDFHEEFEDMDSFQTKDIGEESSQDFSSDIGVEDFSLQQQQYQGQEQGQSQQQETQQKDEITNFQKEIIFQYLKENIGSNNPDPLSPAIWQDDRAWLFFQNIVNNQLGTNADAFINNVVINTKAVLGEQSSEYDKQEYQEYLQQQQQGGIEGQDIVEKYYISGAMNDIVEYLTQKRGLDENDANYIAYDAAAYNLGTPKGNSLDQRFNFFLNNPDYIPDSVFQSLGNELLQRFDIKNKRDFINYATTYRKPTTEQRELIDFLKNNVGDKLLGILYDSVTDPEVKDWASRNINWVVLSKKDPRDFSLEHNMREEGNQSEKEDFVTDERKVKGTESFEEEDTDRIISIFAEEYLGKKINEMKKIKDDVVNNMYQGDSKNQNIAEKLDIYIDAIEKQVNELFSLNADQANKRTIRNTRRYKNAIGSLGIPRNIIQDVVKHIVKQSGNLNKSISNLTDDEIKNMIKDYNISKEDLISWMPEWKNVITTSSIIEKYNRAGEIKNKIKELQKRGYNDGKSIINNFSKDEMEYFDNNLQKALDFINRTLKQDDIGPWEQKGRDNAEYRNFIKKNDLRDIIKEIQQGSFDESKDPTDDPSEIIDILNYTPYREDLNNLFNNIDEQVNFIQDILNKNKSEIAKERRKEFKKFKQKNYPKADFATQSKDIMRNMYELKQNNEYDEDALRILLNAIEPHKSIREYDKEGMSVGADGKSYTEIYYDLMGKEMPKSVKNKIEVKQKEREYRRQKAILNKSINDRITPRDKERRKKYINNMEITEDRRKELLDRLEQLPTYTPEQKEQIIEKDKKDIEEARNKVKYYEELFEHLNNYQANKKKLNKLLLNKHNLQEKINKRMDKIDKKYQKLIKKYGPNKIVEPIWTKTQKKRQRRDENKIEEIENQIRDIKEEMNQFKKNFKNYASINTKLLKLAYNQYLSMEDEVNKLINVRNNINNSNMKIALDINNIDRLILRKINNFDELMNVIMEK
ncbi:MAG: hypothetical protein ACOCRX_04860 [Candidatus Woesearchaeota archaeon]